MDVAPRQSTPEPQGAISLVSSIARWRHLLGSLEMLVARWWSLLPTSETQRCRIPVDDTAGSWGPWPVYPTCACPLDESSSKCCLFTFADFRGGADISIITTPEIAAEATSTLLNNIKEVRISLGRRNPGSMHPSRRIKSGLARVLLLRSPHLASDVCASLANQLPRLQLPWWNRMALSYPLLLGYPLLLIEAR